MKNVLKGLKRGPKLVSKKFNSNKPLYYTVIAGLGFSATVVLAVKATPKAMKHLEERKKELGADKLSIRDTVVATWKDYLPATSTMLMSTFCLIAGYRDGAKKYSQLMGSYVLAQKTFDNYKCLTKEELGEEKEHEIARESVKRIFESNDVGAHRNEAETPSNMNGVLCYDTITKTFFRSSMNQVERNINELNRSMINEMYITLNDYIHQLGVPVREYPRGDMPDIGWNIDDGNIEVRWDCAIAENGEPYLVIDFYKRPEYSYREYNR